MKHNKNADTLLFLLLFTKNQREKNMKKHSLGVQMLKKDENGSSGYNLSQYLPIPKNLSKIHIYIKYICLNFD